MLYKVVRGASPDRVVRRSADGLRDRFVAAARELAADGADGITTNCGFLSLFQRELADAAGIPVAASSLMQVEMVNRLLPAGRKAGILTISASTLSERHLREANVPAATPVGTTEGGREFTRVILENEMEMDVEIARRDNVEAARELVSGHPAIGALVLECTNMTPFAADIGQAVGLPVFSMVSFVNWFQSSLQPRVY